MTLTKAPCNPNRPPAWQQGFTLIEIIVALVIFALIGLGSYSLLTNSMTIADQVELKGDRLAELQRAELRMEQDIVQFAFRSTRNEFGDRIPLLRGETGFSESSGYLEFTRSGWSNPAALPRSDLEHVIYKLEDGTLWRLSWYYLDHAEETADLKRPLLTGVTKLTLGFLEGEDLWRDSWNTANSDAIDSIPRAISVEIELFEGVTLKRVYRLGVAAK